MSDEEKAAMQAAITSFNKRLGLGDQTTIPDHRGQLMVIVRVEGDTAWLSHVTDAFRPPIRYEFSELKWLLRQHAIKGQQIQQLGSDES